MPKHRSELDRVSEMPEMDRIWTDFGFSFDAVPTMDMVLYFGGLMKEDRDRWRRLRDISSSRTN